MNDGYIAREERMGPPATVGCSSILNSYLYLKITALSVLFILALVAPYLSNNPWVGHMMVMACIFILLVLGLDLITGHVGDLSLAHAAFYGVGAYSSALLTMKMGLSFWSGFLLAALLTSLMAFGVGFFLLRLRHAFFALATLAFAESLRVVISNLSVVGGYDGINDIPAPRMRIAGLIDLTISGDLNFYYLAIAAVLLSIFLIHRIVNSGLGRAFIAIRENEKLAESLGISVFRYRMIAFVMGAFFAGMAGSLYAHYIQFISPNLLSLDNMITMQVMLVVGGMGTMVGPILGAVVFLVVPEYLRLAEQYRMIIFAFIVLITVLFLPKGLWGKIRETATKLKDQRAGRWTS